MNDNVKFINVPVFSGTNFNNWQFRIRSILEREQLLDVVDNDPEADAVAKSKKDFVTFLTEICDLAQAIQSSKNSFYTLNRRGVL